MNKVSKVVATRSFENAVKSIKKDHKTSVLKELRNTVDKLINLEITKQKSNHPLKDCEGHIDLHIDGSRFILLYRYDADVLILSLRLQHVVNHDQLASYNKKKYKAPAHEYDPNNIIETSSILCDYDNFIAWYDNLSGEEQWEVDDIADTEGIPFYEDASDEQLSWLYDQCNHAGSNSSISASDTRMNQYDRRHVISINNHDYAVRYNTIYTGQDADPWDMWLEFRFSISRLSPYDDANYAYCFGSEGTVKIYRYGKLIDKTSYMNSDDMGVENEEWCQTVIDETIRLLERINHSIEPRMVYNTKQISDANIAGAKELDPYTSSIEVSLEGLIYRVGDDGYASIEDNMWVDKSEHDKWYDDTYDVVIGYNDDILIAIQDVLEDKTDLFDIDIPGTKKKLHGYVELYYTIEGLEYEDEIYPDEETFDRQIFSDNITIDWNTEESKLIDFSY